MVSGVLWSSCDGIISPITSSVPSSTDKKGRLFSSKSANATYAHQMIPRLCLVAHASSTANTGIPSFLYSGSITGIPASFSIVPGRAFLKRNRWFPSWKSHGINCGSRPCPTGFPFRWPVFPTAKRNTRLGFYALSLSVARNWGRTGNQLKCK